MLRTSFLLYLATGVTAMAVGFGITGEIAAMAVAGLILMFFALGWMYPKSLAWLTSVGIVLAVCMAALGTLLAINFTMMALSLGGFLAAWSVAGYRDRARNQADTQFTRRTLGASLGVITLGTFLAISTRIIRIEANFWIALSLGLALIVAMSILFAYLRNTSQTQA